MTESGFRKAFLLALVILISVAFLWMLRSFLLTILIAATLSGLAYPLYVRLERAFGHRRAPASLVTLVLLLVLVIAPLAGILGVVVNQALRVTERVQPVVQRLVNEPLYFEELLQRVPGIDRIEPYREQIVTGVGNGVNALGGFLVASLSSTTRGTVSFFFHFFVLLYTMFFLLMDGPGMLQAMLRYLPLRDAEKEIMKDRFMSVTRATVKGTIVIGIIQGALSGLAFWVVGIPDTLFWAIVMMVLSILPAIGAALVWVPACIILVATGSVLSGLLLAAFCSLIVGSVDNLLRPRLVGRDTKMHDLVILFSTLGGILAFGPIGFILGPILAGLFVTSWEIFGVAYRDLLNGTTPRIITGAPADADPVTIDDPVA